MIKIRKIVFIIIVLCCITVLVISIYPGWLDSLFFPVLVICMFISPLLLLAALVVGIIMYKKGLLRISHIPWSILIKAILISLITCILIYFYIPRRIVFLLYQTEFEHYIENASPSEQEQRGNQKLGPYTVDEYLVDKQGGKYIRVNSGADGIGPDLMSYGFCFKPNTKGTPFGAAHYRICHLVDDWYWFHASDDWFLE